MSTQSLFNYLRTETSATCQDDLLLRFGDAPTELQAAVESAVVLPLPELIRISVTGKDRARFLHNFCTNNINDLQPGCVCEAFFTDVKAKIVAHGYVAAAADQLEIWMLPGAEEQLLRHLDRYIITDDVKLESMSPAAPIAVTGPRAQDTLASAGLPAPSADSTIQHAPQTAALRVAWNGRPMIFVDTESPIDAWHALTSAGARAAGWDVFEHLRMQEGLPRIGIDLTSDHMAPEADRNQTAISYTKGCYLGQEPIARLDAMGHVNRKLFRCTIVESTDTADDPETLPLVTGYSDIGGDVRAMAVLPIKLIGADGQATGRRPDGSIVRLQTRADS